MKYQLRLLVALSLFAPILAFACGGDGGDSRLRVVATTTQIGDFARQVGGERIALTVLLKPNQDAHDFEPQPSQVRALERADLVLRNGIGLDAFVEKALKSSDADVVVVTQGVSLRAAPPPSVAPRGGRGGEIEARVASLPPACRKLVTNHDVLGYYADAYGFEIVGAVIPSVSTEARASAADVADIVRKIRAERVLAIFAEASANPDLIRQVGREAGVKVVDDLYGDSLGPAGSDGATYVEMMRSNTRKIVEALRDCD